MRRIALFAVSAVAVAAASCGPPVVSDNATQPAGGPRSPGQQVYDAQGCGRCHAIGGVGRGIDLSKVGAKHDAAWIADHVRDPKKHNPASRMGPYPEDKLSQADLTTLADYLAGMK